MTPETLLLRQIHPTWIRAGRITSQVFTPTPKDKKQLSMCDGDQLTAREAHAHYTQQLELSSVGVMAVAVAECQQQELPVVPDPVPFPAHVVLDFRAFSNAGIRTTAKHLTHAARVRDWQYYSGVG